MASDEDRGSSLTHLWREATQVARTGLDLVERERKEREHQEFLRTFRAKHRCFVADSAMIAGNSEVGDYSGVAWGAMVWSARIGKFCSIGSRSIIGGGEHTIRWPSTSLLFYSKERSMGSYGFSFAERDLFDGEDPAILGHDVWVGAHAIVANKVKIGNGAVVAAGSVVVSDVPAYAVVGGNPARLIRFRFEDEVIAELQALAWWDLDEAAITRLAPFFGSPDLKAFIAAVKQERGQAGQK